MERAGRVREDSHSGMLNLVSGAPELSAAA
jgi:hypothetical protein